MTQQPMTPVQWWDHYDALLDGLRGMPEDDDAGVLLTILLSVKGCILSGDATGVYRLAREANAVAVAALERAKEVPS